MAIAANAPTAQLTAVDISVEALAVARRNAARLALDVRFRIADCLEPIDGEGPLGDFGVVVSNPPYIRDDDVRSLAPEIRCYEPLSALAGGPDGLAFYHRLALAAAAHLEKNGAAVFEIGAYQLAAVIEIMRNAGATGITAVRDLAGEPRVVVAHFPRGNE
jgi:release factor glutamine methyltransferase